MVKRITAVICGIAFLAMTSTVQAGGMNPGIPSAVKISGPTVNGVMIVDTHDYGITFMSPPNSTIPEDKSLVTSIWLQKGGLTASAIFMLPSTFLANFGCDPTLTSTRFAFTSAHANTLSLFVDPQTLMALFSALGLNLATVGNPIITTVSNAVCTPDPLNPSPANPTGTNPANPPPGILSFELNVEFIQP